MKIAFMLFAAILLNGGAMDAQSQANEITTGDFSSQLTGWNGCVTSCSWNSETAIGSAGGSLELDGGVQVQLASMNSNCFTVTPEAKYHFGMQGKTTFSQISSAILMSCAAFSAANCTGDSALLGITNTPEPSIFFLDTEDWLATIPSGYTSANCTATVMGSSAALVDDVYFIRDDAIFFNGFD